VLEDTVNLIKGNSQSIFFLISAVLAEEMFAHNKGALFSRP
jgi:hypothetical protein